MKKQIYFIVVLFIFYSSIINAQTKPDLGANSPNGVITNIEDEKPLNFSLPTTPELNFSRTWMPQVPIQDESLIDETTSPLINLQTTTYTDGKGDAIQNITRYGVSKTNHSVQVADPRVFNDKSYGFKPYSINESQGVQFRNNSFTEQENFYNTLFPNEEKTAFSKNEIIYNTDGSVTTKSYSAGKSFVGQNRANSITDINLSQMTTIRKWEYIGGVPVTTATYNASELFEKTITYQHNKVSKQFTDLEGRLIATLNIINGDYLYNYYVYDEVGRLVYTLPPKAISEIEQVGWNMTTGWTTSDKILENLCSHTFYDELGRVISRTVPSKVGTENIVYDKWHRAILSQDPNLNSLGQWAFTVYDDYGRVAFTGLLNSTNDRSSWQNLIDNPTSIPLSDYNDQTKIFTYLVNGISLIQQNQVYPTSIVDADILSYNYYDNYSHNDLLNFSYSYNFQNYIYPDTYSNTFGAYSELRTMPTKGLLTGHKERIIKSATSQSKFGEWNTSVIYYDDKGRPIQTQNRIENKLNSDEAVNYYNDINNIVYDFGGRVIRNINEHNNVVYKVISGNQSNASTPIQIIVQKIVYEAKTFKPTSIKQKINNQDWAIININTYNNTTGVLEKKSIGGVENQNYTYNIRGQLIGINADYAEDNSINPYGVTFGISMKYDYGFTNNRYDGNLAGIVWRTSSTKLRAYGFSYDEGDRLTNAEFSQLSGADKTIVANWDKNIIDLSEGDYQYDFNGNLTALKRYGLTDVPGIFDIDNLTYSYKPSSNQLDGISDAVTYTPQNNIIQDFQDLNAGTDYTYDINGNLKTDANKGITNIDYSFLNKPLSMQMSGGGVAEYVYTASGNKLDEIINDGINPISTISNVGAFVYKNGTIDYLNQPEGKAVYNASNNNYDYSFYVKDHLGNVRTIVDAKPMSMLDYFATHEVAYGNLENMIFENIDNVRGQKKDAPTEKSANLDANIPDKRIGTALLLKVMAGDKFGLSTEAYYNNSEPTNNTGEVQSGEMLESIIGSLLGNQTGFNTNEYNSAEIVNGTFTKNNYVNTYSNLIDKCYTNSTKPKAFLNYLVFNENMQLIPEQSGAIQINSANNWHVLETLNMIEIKQGGYLATYVSNASKEYVVSFDNIHIQYMKGHLAEENHYYPYGLTYRESPLNTATTNTNLYQTKKLTGMIGSNAINLYDFHARQYDPVIGRFTSLDPKEQYVSGYIGMGNNPANGTDPDGMLFRNPGKAPDSWDLASGTASDRPVVILDGRQIMGGSFEKIVMRWGTGGYGGGPSMPGLIQTRLDVGPDGKIIYRDGSIDITRKGGKYVTTFSRNVPATDFEYTYTETGQRLVIHGAPSYRETVQVNASSLQSSFSPWNYGNYGNYWNNIDNIGNGLSAGDFVAGFYSDYVHNHTTYKTTKGIEKTIFKANGEIRSQRALGFARASKFVRILGLAGSAASTFYSGNKVYNQMQEGGIEQVDVWDAADTGVGLLGTAATAIVMFGLTSNPIGWGIIGTGALIYGGARLGYDIYNDYIK